MALATESAVEEYVLRSVDIEQDCEKLAAMWLSSDDQWPGTWSKGVPITAQRMREWLTRENRLDALVWDTGDAIAGYCSLWQQPDEPNVTYIALLNVSPDYQKLSLARKFLTHYVQRVIELGSVRLDLHTWAGNLKAVPLYKKCGFCWMPGTSVWMLNFLPAILTMPCARSFFQKHDWYKSLKRELTQSEDDERWEGIKVFTYRFEADGDNLMVWVDREARAITAVETDKFFAAAIPDEAEPAGGLPTTMRWKLRNKRPTPMRISLIASGTPDLQIDYRTALELAPGEETTLEADVQVAVKLSDIKPDRPAPRIKSLVIIDGEVLELSSGLRPRTAIEVSTHPEYITLTPGVPQTVEVQLHNALKQPVTATVSLAPEPGLDAEWTPEPVELAAEGYGVVPVTLRAVEGGVFDLSVALQFDADGKTVHLAPKPQAIFVLPLGGVLGAHTNGKLRAENETMRVQLYPNGAEVAIFDRATGKWLGFHVGHSAPPTFPSEYRGGTFDLAMEQRPGQVVLHASMASNEHPQFVLRKRVIVNASSVVSVELDFDNLGPEERSFQALNFFGADRENAMVTLPLAVGVTRGSGDTFPGSADDDFRKASAYAEPWLAVELPNTTLGVVWGDDVEEVDFGWGLQLLSRMYTCPPRSRVQPAPIHIVVSSGGWPAVQQLWRRLAGQSIDVKQLTPTPSNPLAARLEPPVAVAVNGAIDSTLVIEHLIPRSLTGAATLLLPDGWRADETTFVLEQINWRKPLRAELPLKSNAAPGVQHARLELRSRDADLDVDLPLVRLGDTQPVNTHTIERDGQSVLCISNGLLELDVAPQFGGTLCALRTHGVNHLASPFPQPTTLAWMSPWYGGVMPVVLPPDSWGFPGKLVRETFESQTINVCDGHNIQWHGVRLCATLSEEKLRGLVVEIDTLTVGGSPVVKQVLRVINQTPVTRHLGNVGFGIYTQPDGERASTTLWSQDQQLKATDRIAFVKAGHWGAAHNPRTGRALAVVTPLPELALAHYGADGGHFEFLSYFHLPANGHIEMLCYLVLTDDLDTARRWEVLKDLKRET